MRPDGAGRRCVTCDTTIPKGFVGQPAWHPDGRHLVVQAESPNARHRFLNHLAWGIDNDLWLVDVTTGAAEKIWSTPRRHAALHPHFNRDGSKLIFAERSPTGRSFRRIRRLDLGADGENQWDGWRIRMVDRITSYNVCYTKLLRFLKGAKAAYTRLQASWDARDMEDLRHFTSQEVFAEVEAQAASASRKEGAGDRAGRAEAG